MRIYKEPLNACLGFLVRFQGLISRDVSVLLISLLPTYEAEAQIKPKILDKGPGRKHTTLTFSADSKITKKGLAHAKYIGVVLKLAAIFSKYL